MFLFEESQEGRKEKYYQNAIVVSLGSDNRVILYSMKLTNLT